MNIRALVNNFVVRLNKNNENLLPNVTITMLKNENDLLVDKYNVNRYIINLISNIEYQLIDTPLQVGFLFVDKKILINSEDINLDQYEFDNYLLCQIGYVLSGLWGFIDISDNIIKNNILIWLQKLDFENVSKNFNNRKKENVKNQRIILIGVKDNIKFFVPEQYEKKIIFHEMINSSKKYGNGIIFYRITVDQHYFSIPIHRCIAIITKQNQIMFASIALASYNDIL